MDLWRRVGFFFWPIVCRSKKHAYWMKLAENEWQRRLMILFIFNSNDFQEQIVPSQKTFSALPIKHKNIWTCVNFVFVRNRHFKSYRPLKDNLIVSGQLQPTQAHSCSGPSVFWNLLNQRGTVDNCPLLQDRPVWTTPSATQPHLKPSNVEIMSLGDVFYTFSFFTCFLMKYGYLIKHFNSNNSHTDFFFYIPTWAKLCYWSTYFDLTKLIWGVFSIKPCCLKVVLYYF